MKKMVRLLLIFNFCFLYSDALKAASLEDHGEKPVVFRMPVANIPIAAAWFDTVQNCRNEMALFIDHTQNLLSLTNEAKDHLEKTKKLDNYAPLLGFEADGLPYLIKPEICANYMRFLKSSISLLESNYNVADKIQETLLDTPMDGDLSHTGFVGRAIMIASVLLNNLKERNETSLLNLKAFADGDESKGPVVCVGNYENLLPVEILPQWQYEAMHMKTQWAVAKKLWDFISEWDSNKIVRQKKGYPPIFAKILSITDIFGNLPYLQGTQAAPNIESLEMSTPQKIVQAESIFTKLQVRHKESKDYRENLQKKFAKSAARREQELVPNKQVAEDSRDLDDLMALIGGNEVPEEPAQPKKAKAKQRVKVHSDTLVKAPDPKAQAKALAASKKKAAINTLVAEVAAAAVAPAPEGEVKQELSVDRQRRREARETRRHENDLRVAASAHAREAALEKKDTRKSKAERESDHALKVTAIASYTAHLSKNLDSGLRLLNQAAAEFFHDFYTKSTPVCWWEFCDNFEALGGTIIHKSGSIHIFEWKDPTVAGVVLAKEIHDPHPHYLIGNHYRLHIGRFLNVVRAFRHERMRAYLHVTTGKIFDRRTFDEDLIRFWR